MICLIRFTIPLAAAGRPGAEAEINQAIGKWDLRRLGWRGFEQLPWVKAILAECPEARELAQTCSSHRPGYLERAQQLMQEADPQDHPRLKDWFLGKLALEELSCRANGAGAGLCDRRRALLEIYQTISA